MSPSSRIVITGSAVVSPLGNSNEGLVEKLRKGESGIQPLDSVPTEPLRISSGAEAREFTGHIDDYGPLEKTLKRTIKKGSKVMCREIEMGVAVAQKAIVNADLDLSSLNRERIGVVYGCDYIMSLPEEYALGVAKCIGEDGQFDFQKWGEMGRPEVNPLWLLKYLPNMPASHVAIYNDLRGANNSITIREASAGAAVGEAYSTISRGHADAVIVGSTGSRIHPLRTLHATMQEELASDRDDPTTMARPFAQDRDGAVVGEGAGAMIVESLEHANARGANIIGEIVGYGGSAVGVVQVSDSSTQDPKAIADSKREAVRTAMRNVYRSALAGSDANDLGHIHAFGIGTQNGDAGEAEAIQDVFGSPDQSPPVTTAKGHFGNLGAGGGIVEMIASLHCLGGELFAIRNLQQAGQDCPIHAVTKSSLESGDHVAGDSFVSASITPQGQAFAVRIQSFQG